MLPNTLVSLRVLFCYKTLIAKLPDKSINLVTLGITETLITELPNTLISLRVLFCYETLITKFPDTLVTLYYRHKS